MRKLDPDGGLESGGGDGRRLRSSGNGVFCSRLMLGGFIDDEDDDDDEGVAVGRVNFAVDGGRKSGL